jgi:hypothetical protein
VFQFAQPLFHHQGDQRLVIDDQNARHVLSLRGLAFRPDGGHKRRLQIVWITASLVARLTDPINGALNRSASPDPPAGRTPSTRSSSESRQGRVHFALRAQPVETEAEGRVDPLRCDDPNGFSGGS